MRRSNIQTLSPRVFKEGKNYWVATYRDSGSGTYKKASPKKAYSEVKSQLHDPHRDNFGIDIDLFNALARSLGKPEEKIEK